MYENIMVMDKLSLAFWRNNYQINGTRTTNLSYNKHITNACNSFLAAGNAKVEGKATLLHWPGQVLRAP
jgi:hypothetical protein